jgi:hypothetical protein
MKKPADAILAVMDEDEDAPDSKSGGDDEKKRAAGEEFAAALKSGDGLKIAQAFEDLKALCEY